MFVVSVIKVTEMKELKYIILLLILPLHFACKTEIPQTSAVTVLIDVSDERFKDDQFSKENLPRFLDLMKLNREAGGYSGGEIKFSLINEVSDSKSKSAKIAAGKTGVMGENPLNRKDEVNRFCDEIELSFSEVLESADWGTNASKIYQKVARECIKLSRKDADRKCLIIYSDMLENSQLFSFYRSQWKKEIESMIEDPEKTLEKLGKKGPALPDISELEIYIIATRTEGNDEKVNLSEQLWTALFEYQGATVTFNSTLEV